MTTDSWHYARNGTRFGPLPRAELAALATRGEVGPDDLVWHPDFGPEWRPARTVDGLKFSTPPPPSDAPAPPGTARRVERAFGPLVAGMILDAADLFTVGPGGLLIGFPVGLWLGWIFRLRWWQILLAGCAAGIYCAIPWTNFIPLATLIGAFAQFRDMGRRGRDGTAGPSET